MFADRHQFSINHFHMQDVQLCTQMQRVALELKTFLKWTWTLVGPTFFNQTYFMFFCNWIKCRPLLNLTYFFQISGSSLQVQIHLCKQTTDQNSAAFV